jgi:hypothetical protein
MGLPCFALRCTWAAWHSVVLQVIAAMHVRLLALHVAVQ